MGANTLKRAIVAGVVLVGIGVIVRLGGQTISPPPDRSLENRAAEPAAPQPALPPAAPDRAVSVPRPAAEGDRARRRSASQVAAADVAGDADTAEGPLEALPEDIPSLARMALTDPDVARRTEAVNLLAATEDPEAIPFLHQALSDPDAGVRLAVVESLGELDFPGEAPVELLSNVVLQDPESENRLKALQVLADMNGTDAVGLAQKVRNDPDAGVRGLAERILNGDVETPSDETDD